MKIKKIIFISFSLIITMFLISGCNKTINEKHKIIEISSGTDIVINKDDIAEMATYYNYKIKDTIIQLFAVKSSDGNVVIAYNTCGACNPSKDAYFIQDGDYFICQNCKNAFHKDDLDDTKMYGCSPITVKESDKVIDNNTITISSSFIESYKTKFENLNIYTN